MFAELVNQALCPLPDSEIHPNALKVRNWMKTFVPDPDTQVPPVKEPWQQSLSDQLAQGKLEPIPPTTVPRVPQGPPPPDDGLTDRQRTVLELSQDGMSTKEIAAELGISYQTVRGTLQSLEKKGKL
jgi:DNA-binding CsgD family transcriptional regulator